MKSRKGPVKIDATRRRGPRKDVRRSLRYDEYFPEGTASMGRFVQAKGVIS
jgi:hypothetical protein